MLHTPEFLFSAWVIWNGFRCEWQKRCKAKANFLPFFPSLIFDTASKSRCQIYSKKNSCRTQVKLLQDIQQLSYFHKRDFSGLHAHSKLIFEWKSGKRKILRQSCLTKSSNCLMCFSRRYHAENIRILLPHSSLTCQNQRQLTSFHIAVVIICFPFHVQEGFLLKQPLKLRFNSGAWHNQRKLLVSGAEASERNHFLFLWSRRSGMEQITALWSLCKFLSPLQGSNSTAHPAFCNFLPDSNSNSRWIWTDVDGLYEDSRSSLSLVEQIMDSLFTSEMSSTRTAWGPWRCPRTGSQWWISQRCVLNSLLKHRSLKIWSLWKQCFTTSQA